LWGTTTTQIACLDLPLNKATIRIILVLLIIFRWTDELVDVEGAFLFGNFQGENPFYIKLPEGLEQYYPGDMLLLLRTIYRLKLAAREF